MSHTYTIKTGQKLLFSLIYTIATGGILAYYLITDFNDSTYIEAILRTYPNLFLFPLLLGGLLFYVLIEPIRFLFFVIFKDSKIVRWIIFGIWAIAAVGFSLLNIFSSDYGAWEIKESIIEENSISDLSDISYKEFYLLAVLDSSALNDSFVKNEEVYNQLKSNYNDSLKDLVKGNQSYWSRLRWAFLITIFPQMFVFIAVLIIAIMLAKFYQSPELRKEAFKPYAKQLLTACFLIFIWYIFRSANTGFKQIWYENVNNSRLINYAILGALIFVVIVITYISKIEFRKFIDVGKYVIGSLSMGTISILTVIDPVTTSQIFRTDGEAILIVIFALLLVVVLWELPLKELMKKPAKD